MNFDMNAIMKLMIASSLMSGKGFDFGNFMGGLTLDKILGLQMLANTDFGGVTNEGNGLTREDFERLVEKLSSKNV